MAGAGDRTVRRRACRMAGLGCIALVAADPIAGPDHRARLHRDEATWSAFRPDGPVASDGATALYTSTRRRRLEPSADADVY